MSRDDDEAADLGDEPITKVRGPVPDFSRERQAEGRSGPAFGVVIVIVALVGAGFWWLTGNRVGPAAATTPAAAPAKAEAASPAAAPAQRPSAATTSPAGPDATPTGAVAATPPSVAPKAAHAHKRHKKPPKQKPVKLPRLPNPPPE